MGGQAEYVRVSFWEVNFLVVPKKMGDVVSIQVKIGYTFPIFQNMITILFFRDWDPSDSASQNGPSSKVPLASSGLTRLPTVSLKQRRWAWTP